MEVFDMTIDEAIAHAREVADTCEYEASKYDLSDSYESHVAYQEGKCAEEHEQLAEWLEDYKQIKMLIPREQALKAEYNKALDDIVTIIKERVGMDWEWDFCFIEQIAEQLKAGGMNEYNI